MIDVTGEFCECSNYECPRNEDNQICSNNGYCFCGDCDCNKTANGSSQGPEGGGGGGGGGFTICRPLTLDNTDNFLAIS